MLYYIIAANTKVAQRYFIEKVQPDVKYTILYKIIYE